MSNTGATTLTRPTQVDLGTLSDSKHRGERPARLMGRALLNRAHNAPPARPLDAKATAIINEMVVRSYFESVMNRRNLEVINTTHASDWVGSFGLAGQSALYGRKANIARLESFFALVPDATFDIAAVRSVRDTVVVQFWLSGTRPDGPGRQRVPFRTPGVAIHHLVHGRISKEHVVHPRLDRHVAGISGRPPKATATSNAMLAELWEEFRQGWVGHPYDYRNVA